MFAWWHGDAAPWLPFCTFVLYPTWVPYLGVTVVAHTIREKAKLLGRIRRIRGQLEALERSVEEEKGCSEVLHQIAAARGAMNGLMVEVLAEHIEMHVANPAISSNTERARGADELIEVIRSYLK
jgi:FrmR/RcnR family transcriptional regulator, repressor of frmRAB operon